MTKMHTEEADQTETMNNQELSRRSFLYSLGALALTASASPRLLAQTAGFAHPGLLHTQADFNRMAANLNNEPWKAGWARLLANTDNKLGWTPNPVSVVYRGLDGVNRENYWLLYRDVAVAYACALRWKITNESAFANKAVEIMNAWSGTLTAIAGNSDQRLAAGIYGYEFANAGEIMRSYNGWAAADFTRFKGMMRNIFYASNNEFLVNHNGTEITHYWANWDLCNMASVMAIGVLCDEPALFNQAVDYFKGGAGNGAASQAIYFMHPGHLGQWQESGRDQGHSTLGIALMGALCEMAWNQGVDLYGYHNNRFLAGAEYVAKSNLIESGTSFYTVPYVTYTNSDRVDQRVFSTTSQGNIRPCWALVYHHYVNRKGLAAPYTRKMMELVHPESGGGSYGTSSGGYDQLGYGTLTCSRPAIPAGVPPSGLTAIVQGGAVVLSWWGGAYATSYNVKRSTSPTGPFTLVAGGIRDLLSYTDSGMVNGNWYYVVTAMSPSGETAPSNVARARTGIVLHTRLNFDEGTGTVALDASGNGNHGTLLGGAGWGAGQVAGTALSLDGNTGHVALPPDIMTGVGDFSISTWLFWPNVRTWERLFDFGTATGRYMMLTARGSTGRARFAMSLNGREGERFVESPSQLPHNWWIHVAVTLSGRTCTMYVNGSVVGTNTDMFFAPFQLGPTSRNWIGRSQRDGEPNLKGRIDDFRIYHGALSAAQVAAVMNRQPI